MRRTSSYRINETKKYIKNNADRLIRKKISIEKSREQDKLKLKNDYLEVRLFTVLLRFPPFEIQSNKVFRKLDLGSILE